MTVLSILVLSQMFHYPSNREVTINVALKQQDDAWSTGLIDGHYEQVCTAANFVFRGNIHSLLLRHHERVNLDERLSYEWDTFQTQHILEVDFKNNIIFY